MFNRLLGDIITTKKNIDKPKVTTAVAGKVTTTKTNRSKIDKIRDTITGVLLE